MRELNAMQVNEVAGGFPAGPSPLKDLLFNWVIGLAEKMI